MSATMLSACSLACNSCFRVLVTGCNFAAPFSLPEALGGTSGGGGGRSVDGIETLLGALRRCFEALSLRLVEQVLFQVKVRHDTKPLCHFFGEGYAVQSLVEMLFGLLSKQNKIIIEKYFFRAWVIFNKTCWNKS